MDHYATLVSLFLAVVALIYTLKALSEARSQTKDLRLLKKESDAISTSLKDSEDRIEALATVAKDISGSLSTKVIGPFPDYVKGIANLLNQATDDLTAPVGGKSIVIVCDVPCYCIFSGPNEWLVYRNALETAVLNREQRPVQIVWMNSDRRQQLLREQFKPSSDDDATVWKTDVVRKRLTLFLERYARDKNANLITYAEFNAIVEHQHAKIITDLQAAELKEHRDRLHLLFWIVDDEEAIFAIPNFADRGRGLGFYIRDKKIIDGLRSIYSRLSGEAREPDYKSMQVSSSRFTS